MDPNQLMQILQMLSQQGGGGMLGGMGMGGMGTAMPQIQLSQLQPTAPATRVLPAAPLMGGGGGGHSLTAGSLLQGVGQQQPPATQTGTPLQSVQGPDPSTLPPAVQAGMTQMQSPVPLQAAQAPDLSAPLGGVTPDQSRLGPSGGGGGGILSTLGTVGTDIYHNLLAHYGLGPNAQTAAATRVMPDPGLPSYNQGQHSLKLGALIGAALAA